MTPWDDAAVERVAEALYARFGGAGGFAWRECARVILQAAGPPVPEGWVLVPREPTPEMMIAAANGWASGSMIGVGWASGSMIGVWQRMLDAAPEGSK